MRDTIIYRDTEYEEEIASGANLWLAGLFIGFTLLFLGFFIYSVINPEILIDDAPAWLWLIMLVVFAPLGLMIFKMRKIEISLTSSEVNIRYGFFSHRQPFSNIAEVSVVEKPGLRYGGWGIRIPWSGKKPVIVFNILSAPTVELTLKEGKYSKLVFSSRKPDEIAGIISRKLR